MPFETLKYSSFAVEQVVFMSFSSFVVRPFTWNAKIFRFSVAFLKLKICNLIFLDVPRLRICKTESFINSFISFSVRNATATSDFYCPRRREARRDGSRSGCWRFLHFSDFFHSRNELCDSLCSLRNETVDNESQFTATRLLMSMLLHQPSPAANLHLRLCTKRKKFCQGLQA